MPALKIKNIVWREYPSGVDLPTEAIVEISDSEYEDWHTNSNWASVLESHTGVAVKSHESYVILEKGPVLKYHTPRPNQLVYSGRL